MEGYVFTLDEAKYLFSINQKHCEIVAIKISKCKFANIFYGKSKNWQPLLLNKKKKLLVNTRRKACTVIDISKMKSPVIRQNPPTEKSITKSLNIFLKTINKITN